jgi:hypothetical protein
MIMYIRGPGLLLLLLSCDLIWSSFNKSHIIYSLTSP